MKWSWKIGRFAGIDVFVHATFLLLVAFFGFSYWQQTRSVQGTLQGLAFLFFLFLSVILHEFGHALTARRFGIHTRDITLLPIGGVARLERMPEKPVQELWVALAGPAVNLVIAALIFVAMLVTNSLVPLTGLSLTAGSFVSRLLIVNLSLALFNLLPAFPMDGGRVLRSLLAMRMDYVRSTQVAAGIGQGMALLFGILGLFTNPFLVFIALFVWIGAQQESSLVQMKYAFSGIPVRRAMLTDYKVLQSGDGLRTAIDYVLAGSQQDFPVLDGGKVAGILTRGDLLAALSRHREDARVSEVAHSDFEAVHPGEMLEAAFTRLQACGCHTFPVVQDGQLVGLLTSENIGEFMMIQSALEGRGTRRRIA
jgi:Zn-dependent protease/CBS domain-containing protein